MREIPFPRWCFAAAHVAVLDSYRDVAHSVKLPGTPDELARYVDWESTLRIRTRLDELGFGIAEAMDTAQRFSIGWDNARRLIEETGRLGLRNGFIAGAGADARKEIRNDDDAVASVVEEAEAIQRAGGYVIVLPLPHLALSEASADRYARVYGQIVDRLDGPLFVHWLGEAFMPALQGYFPGESFFEVMAHDTRKVRGAKLSLLDAEFERAARDRLLRYKQIILTGDDYKFGELMLGDDDVPIEYVTIGEYSVPIGRFSHALLGVLDAIAEPMARALGRLAEGEIDAYLAIARECEVLGQWIFQPPTQYYKSGLAYLAQQQGLQPNAMLLNHEEHERDATYYTGLVEHARAAGVLPGA